MGAGRMVKDEADLMLFAHQGTKGVLTPSKWPRSMCCSRKERAGLARLSPETRRSFSRIVVICPRYFDQIFTRFQTNQRVPKKYLTR